MKEEGCSLSRADFVCQTGSRQFKFQFFAFLELTKLSQQEKLNFIPVLFCSIARVQAGWATRSLIKPGLCTHTRDLCALWNLSTFLTIFISRTIFSLYKGGTSLPSFKAPHTTITHRLTDSLITGSSLLSAHDLRDPPVTWPRPRVNTLSWLRWVGSRA